jgi:hypothetical protein
MCPWRVCDVFADARGGSFSDRTAVSCQLYSLGGSVKCLQMPGGSFYDRTVLWRVRKGVRGCQRGGLFAVARQLGAGSLFSIVRQLGASSICLWRARRGICRCRREVRGSQVPALFPWRVCELFTDARGGSFDRMAVRCQLLFLWRVVRVFADARGAVSYNGS